MTFEVLCDTRKIAAFYVNYLKPQVKNGAILFHKDAIKILFYGIFMYIITKGPVWSCRHNIVIPEFQK